MTHHHRRSRLLAPFLALALFAAACGDDASGDASDAGGDDTARPTSYAERGPYAVGEIDLALETGETVAVFYPVDGDAVPADAEPYSYEGADIFEPAVVDLLPGALSATIAPDDTWVGVPASGDGSFPVVLHSHGAAGNVRFANLHNAHTASWGNVVVVVDHPERGVVAAIDFTGGDGGRELDLSDAFLDTEQLLAGLDLAVAEGDDPDSPLAGAVDADRVAAEGHSAGGGASGSAAYDERVDLWIGQATTAPAPPDTDLEAYVVEEEDDGGQAYETIDGDALRADTEPPPVPSLLIAAEGDSVVELDGVEDAYGWLDSPKRLVVIAGSGHAVFVDPCLNIREEGGLGGFVEALGLDPDEIPLIELGEGGCLPEDTSPEEIWPLVDHLTVAQVEATFGEEEVGEASLDPEYLATEFPALLEEVRSG